MNGSYLRSRVIYDPLTGEWTWLPKEVRKIQDASWNTRWAGKKIHYVNDHGYLEVCINRVKYRMHRLAWLYMTDSMPKEIDHINRNKLDCRWSNLRIADRAKNMCNRTHTIQNKLGVKGVHFERHTKRFKAQIQTNGRNINLGRYDTVEEARLAYAVAAAKYHKEFARTT